VFFSVASSPERLGSTSTDRRTLPTFCLATVGKRTFPVYDASLWNELPSDIRTSTVTPIVFRQRDSLFCPSYQDLLIWQFTDVVVGIMLIVQATLMTDNDDARLTTSVVKVWRRQVNSRFYTDHGSNRLSVSISTLSLMCAVKRWKLYAQTAKSILHNTSVCFPVLF